MHKLVWIAVGGLLGTLCRYALSAWVDGRAQSPFPYGTLGVNLAGCFAAGFLFPLLEHATGPPERRRAVFSGFPGGFAAFSAFGPQTAVRAGGGMLSVSALNVWVSNVAGLAMVWIGGSLSRSIA